VALEDPARRAALRQQGYLILALDGLQPDKGHEVLWSFGRSCQGNLGCPEPAGLGPGGPQRRAPCGLGRVGGCPD